MKIEYNKKPIARTGDEYDLICWRKVYFNSNRSDVNEVRRIKRQMNKRLRVSGKIIVKQDAQFVFDNRH